MEHGRVEYIARALARSAGFDPDELVLPDTLVSHAVSMTPAADPMPAWRRFLHAAQMHCDARTDLEGPLTKLKRRPARSASI